jgi:hypothetical protein
MYLDEMPNFLQPCPYMLSHTSKPFFFSKQGYPLNLDSFVAHPKMKIGPCVKTTLLVRPKGYITNILVQVLLKLRTIELR